MTCSGARPILILLAALAGSPAAAQQSGDPANLQRLLTVIEAQRNQALTQHALAEARAAGLAEELTKALAQVKEMEASKADRPAKETP